MLRLAADVHERETGHGVAHLARPHIAAPAMLQQRACACMAKVFTVCCYSSLAFQASEYQSHRWTVYMRSPTGEDLQHVIKKARALRWRVPWAGPSLLLAPAPLHILSLNTLFSTFGCSPSLAARPDSHAARCPHRCRSPLCCTSRFPTPSATWRCRPTSSRKWAGASLTSLSPCTSG